MSCDQDSVALLRRAAMKLTPQRLLVVNTLRHAGGHVTAADICEHVRAAYPYVDISTVYRTLATLKRVGVVSETDMGRGELTYEWVGEQRHHHLVCTDCQTVSELDHASLERLSADLMGQHGFEANLDHLAIFGRCGACRATSRT